MIVGLFAVDNVGGMGVNGHMPWPHNKDDMQWFKKTTQGQIVVMGRRTWEAPDMPKPLPGRVNVLFTNEFIERDDVEQIRGDVCEALTSIQKSNKKLDVFVIGGPNLLEQAKPVLEKLLITRINGEYFSDTKLNLDSFLDSFSLVDKINLGSCTVEEYKNETIQTSTRTRTRKRTGQD